MSQEQHGPPNREPDSSSTDEVATQQSNKPKRSALAIGYWGIFVLMILLSMVSGYTTFTGVQAVFEDRWIAIFLTIGIQGLILMAISLTLMPSLDRSAKATMGVVCWLALMTSIIFSVSWYEHKYRQNQHVSDVAKGEILRITEPLVRAADEFRNMKRAVDAASALSIQRHEVEKKRGGTCGDRSGPGDGPRARLRAEDASALTLFAAEFANASAGLDSLAAVGRDLSQNIDPTDPASFEAFIDAVRDLHMRAVQLLQSKSIVNNFQDWARQRILIADHGFKDGRGRLIKCHDPNLRTFIARALSVEPIHLDAFEKPEFFRPGREQAVEFAFQHLIAAPIRSLVKLLSFDIPARTDGNSIVSSAWVLPGAMNAGGVSMRIPLELFPLYMAFYVDGAILFLGFGAHLLQRARTRRSALTIGSQLKRDLSDDFTSILRDLVIRDGGRDFLVTPVGGDDETADVLKATLWKFRGLGVIGEPARVSIDEVERCGWWKTVQGQLLADAKFVEIWPLEKGFMTRLRSDE